MILSAFTVWQNGLTGYNSSFRAYLKSLNLIEKVKLTEAEKQSLKTEALQMANKVILADKKHEVFA